MTETTLNMGDQAYPVRQGSVGPEVVDIRKFYAQTGKFTYDPGFTSTASCEVEQAGTARVTPEQVIEASLFVGGHPLTTKRLCSLLRDEFDRDFVEDAIDRLNRRYVGEHRPYEIRLGEGGYRLVLKYEFEPIRNRVFGLGPKEVKLSQESLEILALVAYRQPLTKQKLEQEKANCGAVVRQLLRRELVSLERGETKQDVTYRTTPRFLEVFGLGSLDELPRAEELDFK